jgi:hypothetical protein
VNDAIGVKPSKFNYHPFLWRVYPLLSQYTTINSRKPLQGHIFRGCPTVVDFRKPIMIRNVLRFQSFKK